MQKSIFSKNSREQRRYEIVLKLQEGKTGHQIASELGISEATVSHIKKLWNDSNGDTSVLLQKKSTGRPPKLNKDQIDILLNCVKEGAIAHGYFDDGWSGPRLAELIKNKFGVEINAHHILKILHKHGFTYQKPKCVAAQQDIEEVNKWIKEDYPEIAEQALKENRVIIFADECGFGRAGKPRATWAEAGKTPILRPMFGRGGMSIFGAISGEGMLYFKIKMGAFDSNDIVSMLDEILHITDKKITMIWDGATIHRSKVVKEYISKLPAGRIRLVRLPAHSPHLNPQEFLWSQLKWAKLKNECFKTFDDARYAVYWTLQEMKNDTELIRSFIRGVRYTVIERESQTS